MDNLFDRLMELFQSTGPVNWRLAREIAESVAGPAEPIDPEVAEDYLQLAAAAAVRLGQDTSLPVERVPTKIDPLDRRGWAGATLEGLGYLVEPLVGKMPGASGAGPFDMLAAIGPALLGLQVGSTVGMMSRTALGRFDLSVPVLDRPSVAFLVPNIEDFAAANDLDRRQVRLWAASLETAHHAVGAVPWMGDHVRNLTARLYDHISFDESGMQEMLGSIQDPSSLERLLEEQGGVAPIELTEEGEAVANDLAALAATVGGYAGEVVAATTGAFLPDLDRISDAMASRESVPSPLSSLVGAAESSTPDGAQFASQVARRWGPESLERLWEEPEHLPTIDELGDPLGWAARVLLD